LANLLACLHGVLQGRPQSSQNHAVLPEPSEGEPQSLPGPLGRVPESLLLRDRLPVERLEET
jgi:hypothetical protein